MSIETMTDEELKVEDAKLLSWLCDGVPTALYAQRGTRSYVDLSRRRSEIGQELSRRQSGREEGR